MSKSKQTHKQKQPKTKPINKTHQKTTTNINKTLKHKYK